jgi:hypothetical protein
MLILYLHFKGFMQYRSNLKNYKGDSPLLHQALIYNKMINQESLVKKTQPLHLQEINKRL